MTKILTKSWASPSLFAVSKFVNVATSGSSHTRVAAITHAQQHSYRVCFSYRALTSLNSRDLELHSAPSRPLPAGSPNVENRSVLGGLSRIVADVGCGRPHASLSSESEAKGYEQGLG
jgi:hypothetical protein